MWIFVYDYKLMLMNVYICIQLQTNVWFITFILYMWQYDNGLQEFALEWYAVGVIVVFLPLKSLFGMFKLK